MNPIEKTKWYKDAVIYEIYPRSFCDSDGDGIGDLKGIISKLDYLKDLGVTAVWLAPCYKTANADNGYDISDYRDINPEYGTLDDWKEMLAQMHARGIKLIMDLVVNHSSDEHHWFQESRKSKDNPYRDYYIWRKGKGKNGKKPPNNWTSRFGGPAWKYDETTGEFYMHLWSEKQPDLNWDNPAVRKEVADIVNYWLDLGVDGFRCDVITYISKVVRADGTIPDGKRRGFSRGDEMFLHGPHAHEYLHELYQETFAHYDCMTVGEAAGVTLEQGILYTGEDREELDTIFTFDHVKWDMLFNLIPRNPEFVKFKKAFADWQNALKGKGWNSLYLENHDQPRSVERFCPDPGDNYDKAAKMLALSYMLLQGTPYVYEGQELGLKNYHFESVSELRDPLALNILGIIKKIPLPGLKKMFLKVMNVRSRDHSRNPIPWNSTPKAGFSDGEPWIPYNPRNEGLDAETELNDPDSILNFYKKVIAFRKGNELIKNGSFKENYSGSKEIWCYERWWRGDRLFVLCNFTNKEVAFSAPKDYVTTACELKLHNYGWDRPELPESLTLRPYEAMAYLLK